jgi:uncharacterized membrane protein YhaH (DUF805 family)
MEQFLTTETLIIELLLIVSLVAIAVRRLHPCRWWVVCCCWWASSWPEWRAG